MTQEQQCRWLDEIDTQIIELQRMARLDRAAPVYHRIVDLYLERCALQEQNHDGITEDPLAG